MRKVKGVNNRYAALRLVVLMVSLVAFLMTGGLTVYADGYIESFTDTGSASEYLKEQMKARKAKVTIDVKKTENADNDLSGFANSILSAAYKHTGVANEGDYLENSVYASYMESSTSKSSPTVRITYTFKFYTTFDQENVFKAEADRIVDSMQLEGKSDYEKVCVIYNFITSHVTYDHDNLNRSDYTLKQSAYAALINKTSVCQGYASLFYYMANSAGLDARVVLGNSYDSLGSQGESHAWNLVKVDDQYYYIDSTWDAGVQEYRYFLKGASKITHKNAVIESAGKKVAPTKVYKVSSDDYWNYKTKNGYTRKKHCRS